MLNLNPETEPNAAWDTASSIFRKAKEEKVYHHFLSVKSMFKPNSRILLVLFTFEANGCLNLKRIIFVCKMWNLDLS